MLPSFRLKNNDSSISTFWGGGIKHFYDKTQLYIFCSYNYVFYFTKTLLSASEWLEYEKNQKNNNRDIQASKDFQNKKETNTSKYMRVEEKPIRAFSLYGFLV